MDFKIAGEGGNAVLQTIHASEGGRAIRLLQQRQQLQQHLQQAKEKLETKGSKRKNINWGGSVADRLEEEFKKETVGLVTAEDFKERRQKLQQQIQFAAKDLFTSKQERRKYEMKMVKSKLSFGDDEAEEVAAQEIKEEKEINEMNKMNEINKLNETNEINKINTEINKDINCSVKGESNSESADPRSSSSAAAAAAGTAAAAAAATGACTALVKVKQEESPSPEKTTEPTFKIRKRICKDPTVDTSYLPDKERDAKLAEERQKLIEEYRRKEEEEKRMPLTVTFSYWDGSGHRRRLQVLRGMSVGEFLERAKRELEKEFVEVRSVPAENLLYVKEDLILPHHITFFELIKSKARGKSGPLFHFGAFDDVRVFSDIRKEKEDSHAGKVVDKKWFERNKHIFPASRWEVFNPAKIYDTYTIRGDERMWKGVADHSSFVPLS